MGRRAVYVQAGSLSTGAGVKWGGGSAASIKGTHLGGDGASWKCSRVVSMVFERREAIRMLKAGNIGSGRVDWSIWWRRDKHTSSKQIQAAARTEAGIHHLITWRG